MTDWKRAPKIAGGDVGPIEPAGVQQPLAHGGVEGGDAQRTLEEIAIDKREAGEVFVKRPRALLFGRVERLEQLRQPPSQIGAILAGAGLEEIQEDVARLEDAGVVREEAEDDAHEEAFQVVAPVARRFEGVVKPPDQLGGFDVDRILVAEGAALHAQDEAEGLDVAGQVGEREGDLLPLVQIVQLEGLEVADQDVAGALGLGEGVEGTLRPVRRPRRDRARRSSVRRSARPARTGR